MRILLAVDASPDSKQAAHIVAHLSEPADLHILNVVDPDALKQAYLPPDLTEPYVEAYRQEVSLVAERVLHEMRDALTPYAREIRLIADTGDPAESIVETAEESEAELVILGQRGMTATPTLLLGGVSQKVALYAPCSVLVVKQPTPALERILLAVDGSEASNKAAQFLAKFPFKAPVRVTVVTVCPPHGSEPLPSGAGASDPSLGPEKVQARGEDFLAGIAETFQGGSYEVDTGWLQGDPAPIILEEAGRRAAQVIVLGARGLKGIKRFLLGSVSQKVLVHAPCSVLIVR